MNNRFDWTILEAINNAVRAVKAAPLVLGGVAGSGGGGGGPTGGFVGQLPQTRVAYDLSELASSGIPVSGMSLLDNLNHIRYAIANSSGGASSFIDLTDVPNTYAGQTGKAVIVNATEDGLEFAEITISGILNLEYLLSADGHLAVVSKASSPFIATSDMVMSGCYIYCQNPGTSGSTIVDVNKNGSTMFSTQGNRPTLAYNDSDQWAYSLSNDTSLTIGDIITIDIDQIATGAEDLVIALNIVSSGGGGGGGGGSTVESYDYILVRDEKAHSSDGGDFTSGDWRTRDINTIVSDEGSNCSLDTNQIILEAGTYECRIEAPAVYCGRHRARLFNITDNAEELIGRTEYAGSDHYFTTIATVTGRFTIATSKTFEVQHRCQLTSGSGFGFGIGSNFDSQIEIFASAEFRKVA